MKLPNFLVIGAQKCGTTALYYALCQHPDIYMSPIKEPFFFIFNGTPPAYPAPAAEYARMLRYTWDGYAALFQAATQQHAIGEASALYLSSYQPEQTAAHIYAFNPQMRLIALLRQPADRAYSAFHYYHTQGWEPEKDFRAALAAEPQRLGDEWAPDLRYWRNGCYFANLKPYFDYFPREQIRVYLYEEWNQHPQAILHDILAFLEVDNKVSLKTKRTNVTFQSRSQWLHRFLDQPNLAHQLLRQIVRGRLRAALSKKLRAYNQLEPPALEPSVRRALTARYRSDIRHLQTLLGRDLSHWMAV